MPPTGRPRKATEGESTTEARLMQKLLPRARCCSGSLTGTRDPVTRPAQASQIPFEQHDLLSICEVFAPFASLRGPRFTSVIKSLSEDGGKIRPDRRLSFGCGSSFSRRAKLLHPSFDRMGDAEDAVSTLAIAGHAPLVRSFTTALRSFRALDVAAYVGGSENAVLPAPYSAIRAVRAPGHIGPGSMNADDQSDGRGLEQRPFPRASSLRLMSAQIGPAQPLCER